MQRTPAEQDFYDFICSIATDTSQFRWKSPTTHDYALARFDRQEYYRKQALQDKEWYQRSQEHYRRVMEEEENQLTLQLTTEVKEHGEQGFWEQF